MNKKLIALAVAAAAFGTQATAVELYNEDGTTFSVGGHVSLNVNDSENGDFGVGSNAPRINMNATHDIGNGYTVDARGEWALNYLNGGENAFTTRLGYIGLTHEDMGRAVIGTQWAPYYDVAGAADMPIAFASDSMYENHGNLGTGRANEMLSYRNGFDLGTAGTIKLGLGYQAKHDDRAEGPAWDADSEDWVVEQSGNNYGSRSQVTLAYALNDFGIGYAHNTGSINYEDSTSNAVSANYGSYGKGLYVAGVYTSTDNFDLVGEKGTITEFVVAYAFSNSLNLSVNYENLENDTTGTTELTESAIQAEYNFTPKFVGFSGYQFDLEGDDNKWAIGARYYL
jgi:predicted porin